MSKTTSENGKLPVHSIRHRRLKAAIWRNETATGPMFNVTLVRSYREGEEWHDSHSLGFDDLMKLTDSLSADEWNENSASNIAPVLDKFLKGTLKHKPATPAPSATGGLKVLGKDAGGHEIF